MRGISLKCSIDDSPSLHSYSSALNPIIMLLTPIIMILCPLLCLHVLPSIHSTQIGFNLDALLSRLLQLANTARPNQTSEIAMEISVIFQLIPSLAANGDIVIPTSVCSMYII